MRAGLRSGWAYVAVMLGLLVSGPAFPAGEVAPGVELSASVRFQNRLYTASRSPDDHRLVIVTSEREPAAEGKRRTYSLHLGSEPALAVFHNQLYVAYRSDDGRNRLVVTSSRDGVNFSQPAREYDELRPGSAPSLAVFNDQLFVGFQSLDARRALVLASSVDGVGFFCPTKHIYPGYRPSTCRAHVYRFPIGGRPMLSATRDRLHVLFPSAGLGHELLDISSSDGIDFNPPVRASAPGAVSRRPSPADREAPPPG